MNELFDEIYDSLSLERLPGIVTFTNVTGYELADMVAANDSFFEEQDYVDSFAGGSLDLD